MFCHQFATFNCQDMDPQVDMETGKAFKLKEDGTVYACEQERQTINAAIKFCSHYKGLKDLKAHFMSKVNEYRSKCTTAATSSSQMLAFYQSCCNMRLNTSNHGNATSGTTHYFAMSGNDGILSPQCNKNSYSVTRPLECVPSCTIISEAQLKAAKLTNTVSSCEGFRIVKRDANGNIAYNSDGSFVKDYNVGVYVYQCMDNSGTYTAKTYDAASDRGKQYIRWVVSKMPEVIDRIEDATGWQMGYPPTLSNPRFRHIFLNQKSGVSVSGGGLNTEVDYERTLNFGGPPLENFQTSTWATYTSSRWTFIDQTNSSTIQRDLKLIANAGGLNNSSQSYADILQHEMMHATMFFNFITNAGALYTWFKEGFADLIRSNTKTRWDNASSPSKFGGLWGELFYGIDWKGLTFSFDNILCTDYYIDALSTLGGSSGGSDGTVDMERHINYAAGYALLKFLFWSVVNGWDMAWRHSQDSSFKIDTVKAI